LTAKLAALPLQSVRKEEDWLRDLH
jgi:hypothetical protein